MFTTFDPPGAIGTYPKTINDAGAITGSYLDSAALLRGFLRADDGSITAFDPPGSSNTLPETSMTAARSRASITTRWARRTASSARPAEPSPASTLRDRSAPSLTPSAPAGTAAGFYEDSSCAVHAFARLADGTIVSFDAPDSFGTYPPITNDRGFITGNYNATAGGANYHGFIRSPGGSITAFDPPGSTYTSPSSINRDGTITGYYLDPSANGHGFVRAIDGTFTIFDPPGSQATFAWSINDSDVICGYYYDGSTQSWIRPV